MPPRIDIAAVLARVQAPAPSTRAPEDAPTITTPLALLRLLRESGIALRLDVDRLSVDVTAGNVTPAMHEALRHHQEALLTMLEWYEERAGMLEYEAGLSRTEAEREAWTQLEARWQ